MTRGYTSRRIATTMRAPRPVETPDTDAARIFRQRWRRQDGKAGRAFSVLALDEQMAEEMGGLRLRGKYDQNILDWTLLDSVPLVRTTSMIYAVLADEEPDETKLREVQFSARQEAKGASA